MKIGDFAKKYGLNITTVRYYVERALLTPERKNNQYVFTSSCMEDMEKILKYKSFRFSLEEIELLFFLEKTTKFRDETVLGIFSRLLKQKQAELEKEEEKIHDTIGEPKAEIRSFSQINYELDHSANGIPFTFLPYLACPDCGKHISVFGESHIDEVAAHYELPVLAKLPIDPKLAAAVDAGKIEDAKLPDELSGALKTVEGLL